MASRIGIHVTSFRDFAPGATHYYAKVWYLDSKDPDDHRGFQETIVQHRLTKAEADRLDQVYYSEGTYSTRFHTREQAIDCGLDFIAQVYGHVPRVEIGPDHDPDNPVRPGKEPTPAAPKKFDGPGPANPDDLPPQDHPNQLGPYGFRGWWSDTDEEKRDSPDPWETFSVILHGDVAGDFVQGRDKIDEVLRASGFRLTLEPVPGGPRKLAQEDARLEETPKE